MLHSLIFFNAISPVHNGAGIGLGLIDRPIIRERITNFPYIQGSSIKGVLKDEYRPKLTNGLLDVIFGPDKGEKHSSAMAFGDANLLCLPIRSLKGGFVWATSPLILYRFYRIVEIADLKSKFNELNKLLNEPIIRSQMTDVLINQAARDLLIVKGEKIILEEFPLKVNSKIAQVGLFAQQLAGYVYSNSQNWFKDEFGKRFVILPEGIFSYFVTYATEVVPNIKIDEETGTSKEGLRSSEYLPAETILYSLLGFEKPRIPNAEALGLNDASAVRDKFFENFPTRIQIGADETKGKGFFELSYIDKNRTVGGENAK